MKIQDLLEFAPTVDKDSALGKVLGNPDVQNTIDKIGNSLSNVFKPSVEKGADVEPKNTDKKTSKSKSSRSVDISDMEPEFERQGIKDPFVKNALMGKFHQEAGAKFGTTEIPFTNTSNKRIKEKLPQLAGMNDDELNALKADPRAFFNRAYGGVLDNTGPDDGYKFRGRGLTGLTGKTNYSAASQALFGDDRLVKNPDLLLDPEVDKKAAVWYYKRAGADKVSFSNQEDANIWAIHKAGGKAYAPGTKLGNIALADLNNKTGNMTSGTGTMVAKGRDNTGKIIAGSTLLAKADELINKYKTELPKFISSISDLSGGEDEVAVIINGKKKKFKNKKEAELAIKLAKDQGLTVDYA